ncbi:MAG: bifunctional folylpolyglutamate synthase/dihydrofolate synthase [Candidatus Omnitrophica bacterium]|nr:bifunctional folylpolyglutamate synthase/dihydrofolate synthase [Candidatus Omnitrophota bacterium]
MNITTYPDAVKYLNSLYNFESRGLVKLKRRDNLSNIRLALARLGNPERSYETAHVAGTKGKGSTSVFLASILKSSGSRTGIFTSPHLSDMRERICVDNVMISESSVVETINAAGDIIGDLMESRTFSFFEMFTIISMMHFRAMKVEYAVFECGLGGRLDATNVIEPHVAGFSPISYDHTHILGNTLEEIAGEKAGVIKEGMDCVTAPQEPGVMGVLEARCAEKNAPLSAVGRDIKFGRVRTGIDGTYFDIEGTSGVYENCYSAMSGDFQAENAATAIGMFEKIALRKGFKADKEAVRKGVREAFIPGRLEIISRDPMMVLDGAQNKASARRLVSAIRRAFKYDRLFFILGISADKDIKGVVEELSGTADEFVITRSNVARAADPLVVRGFFRGNNITVTANVDEALGVVFAKTSKRDLVVVTGSFYLVGEVRDRVLGRTGVTAGMRSWDVGSGT